MEERNRKRIENAKKTGKFEYDVAKIFVELIAAGSDRPGAGPRRGAGPQRRSAPRAAPTRRTVTRRRRSGAPPDTAGTAS